jgi:hypothetical protein
MRSFLTIVLVSAGALAISVTSASAEIACNSEGECWHIKGKADFYKPEHGIHIYPDNWKWGEKEHFKWREPAGEGHGYWKGGVWIKL